MLSHPVTDVASAFAAVSLLLAARLVFSTRPTTLRRCVAGLRGWHVTDRVGLADGSADTSDRILDHVVVAPAALLAVTTTAHAPGLAELRSAEQGARRLREFARRAGVADPVVVPVVLISGTDAPTGGHLLVDGVHLVDDAAPQAWLRHFRDLRIPAVERVALARALDRRAASPRRSRRTDVLLAPAEAA